MSRPVPPLPAIAAKVFYLQPASFFPARAFANYFEFPTTWVLGITEMRVVHILCEELRGSL